ncbi:hypothetical protein CRENBAI_012342 [Crenichthys baileyi]|uniref:Uncharacterized protein n=1 Tax=Crenichthys baileyi TaxID=28760 RepID=A0AAV9S6I8_9TELE
MEFFPAYWSIKKPTEGTSQRDQAEGMVREFKRGEILVKLFSHLATSPSSPWRRLEIAGSLQDWLEARRDFFNDPRIHHAIEAERKRALGEIVASMKRSPGPSSTCLSTKARHGFPAHGLAPDQPSLLLPTPNPVPGPVPEGSWMNRLHTPILFLVLFRRASWMNFLHTPILFLVLFRRGPKLSRPHTLFLSMLCFGGSATDLW